MSSKATRPGPAPLASAGRGMSRGARSDRLRRPGGKTASAGGPRNDPDQPQRLTGEQLELLPLPAFVCDAAGVIVDYNTRAAEAWGRSPRRGDAGERFCGFTRLLGEDEGELPREESPAARALRSGKAVQACAVSAERSDRGRLWILVDAVPLLDAGREVAGVLACFHDVSAIRQEVERRHKTGTAEALARFTANIVHDYCNVLAAVCNNLELVKRRVGDPAVLKFVHGARQSAERGLELTDRLHAFARAQHMMCQSTDLNALIRGMHGVLRDKLPGTIRLALQLSRGLWPAFIDDKQVERAVCQLVLNARDAMPEGGEITVKTANLRLAVDDGDLAPGEYVVVSVTDSGDGMNPDTLARVFEPFFTTKKGGKNAGLGLPMVLGIAHQQGGTARIESGIGRGTQANLYLPRAGLSAAAGSSRAMAEAKAQQRGSVLVVDADPNLRAVAADALANFGFEVLDVDSEPAALDIVRSGRPLDLLVVDYGMTRPNSLSVLQHVQAVRPGLKVLVMTGYPEVPGLLAACHGHASVLRKPFTVSDFAACIRRVMPDRERFAGAAPR